MHIFWGGRVVLDDMIPIQLHSQTLTVFRWQIFLITFLDDKSLLETSNRNLNEMRKDQDQSMTLYKTHYSRLESLEKELTEKTDQNSDLVEITKQVRNSHTYLPTRWPLQFNTIFDCHVSLVAIKT